MRAAIIVGGLVVVGCLGALGGVEAQNHGITAVIWPALTGSKVASTTAAAPAEAASIRPAAPRTVVTDIPAQAPSPRVAPAAAPAIQVAAAPAPQTAPAAPAAPVAAQGPAPLP